MDFSPTAGACARPNKWKCKNYMISLCSTPEEGKDAYLYKPNKDHLIGKGSFYNVFRAIRKHDQANFVIKRSKEAVEILDDKEKHAMLEEIRLMKKISHPFIIKVVDDFLDDSGH